MNAALRTQAPTPASPSFVPVQTGLLQRKCACGGSTGAKSACDNCDEKKLSLQRSTEILERETPHREGLPHIVHEVLSTPGQPLDDETRAFMEPRFGHDFSRVRIHTDAMAAQSAHQVNALAYTVGQDVVFARGQYMPATEKGRHLLAHELTHTLQQSAGGGVRKLGISEPGDAEEREADAQADRVMANEGPVTDHIRLSSHTPLVQRRVGDPAQRPAGLSCPAPANMPPAAVADLFFGTGVVTLSGPQKGQIEAFVSSWRALGASTPVRVDGFASVDGQEPRNWQLSCSRAENVRAELMSPVSGTVAGIPSGMITFFAQGETDEFSRSSDDPNRRATISTPAPAPPPEACVPPPCPEPPPGHQLRVPPIASGAQCRGACGADCDPDACRTVAPLTLCIPSATGNCHRTCTYVVLDCGSHPACVTHDACYDACAAAGERDLCHQGGTCHCSCDNDCRSAFSTFTCVQWATGHGPQPNRIRYTDPATSSAAPGGCPP